MQNTKRAYGGMVTAPHHLASEAGLSVLKDGGNAVEAMVAMAATIAVVYPHMNSIGGDGFWLIAEPGRAPVAVDACGKAAGKASPAFYHEHGLAAIPERGALAALTVAGTISGWRAALDLAKGWGRPLPLPRLTESAVDHARAGIAVTRGQEANVLGKLDGLKNVPGFSETFLGPDGGVPTEGARFRQPRLAATLERLGNAGLDDFYRGDVAASMAADLAAVGSPLARADLAGQKAVVGVPLSADIGAGTLYNLAPPTQGVASLMILGLFDRLGVTRADGFAHIHGLVEATKRAFMVRDAHVTDPAYMKGDPMDFLAPGFLDAEAGKIDRRQALAWPCLSHPGDTVWMGAVDGSGRAVSFIQSTYWEFGSGVVLKESGVVWQNRGISFSLDGDARNPLMPGRKPFHTLNPALARLKDGRVMVYGTMGGEGQPQTQAAVFSRHVLFGVPLQEAVSAPRWLLGRTWGDVSTNLKMENRFSPDVIAALAAAGHDIETVDGYSDLMGHAGAVVSHPDGLLEGASDPRSDGAAMGF